MKKLFCLKENCLPKVACKLKNQLIKASQSPQKQMKYKIVYA